MNEQKKSEEIRTVTIQELADILQLRYETVRAKLKREPAKFPPAIINDITSEKRFLYADVVEWLRGKRWNEE